MPENTKAESKEKPDSINQIHDKILKRILMLSRVAVINLINALFNTNFPPQDSKIVYNLTESIDDELGRTLSDTIITIHAFGNSYKFHVEVEIKTTDTNDTTIVLRFFEYSYRDALRHKEVKGDKISIKFPKPLVILLEHNNKSPDMVTLELDFGDQGTFDFSVPTMKFLNHSLDDLNNQKMVILMPLYLLKLRRKIENAKKRKKNSSEAVRQYATELKDLIKSILKSFEDNVKAGNIDSNDAFVLSGLVEKLYNHLYADIQEFKEERVNDVLDDRLLVKYEAELIKERKRGREIAQEMAQGMAKEMAQGMAKEMAQDMAKEMAQGIAKDMALAMAVEEKLEIAKNLLEQGLSSENIAKATKLPFERIRELQAKAIPVG